MKTVLITGAAGFVGSNLTRALLDRGYRVIGVDNFDDTYDSSFKEEHIAGFATHPEFELRRLDIRDRETLIRLFEETHPSLVAHLAAKADTRAAVADPYPYLSNNIDGTVNVLEASKQEGIENVVFSSSSSVYGNDLPVPWKETAPANRPLSPYGATKRACELLAYTYHHNFNMNITCLRYFNAYGEHNRPNMVLYKWAKALLQGYEIELSGDGSRKRDYTYVGDTVQATIAALEKPLGYEVINVGNNNPVSLLELLGVFEKVIGTKAQVRKRASFTMSVEETYADITKAKELLGWEPRVPLEEGVARLVAWFRANRV